MSPPLPIVPWSTDPLRFGRGSMRSPPPFREPFPFPASGGTLPPAPFSFAAPSEPFCGSPPPAGEAHCLSPAPKAVPPTAPAASSPYRGGPQLPFKPTSHPDTLPAWGPLLLPVWPLRSLPLVRILRGAVLGVNSGTESEAKVCWGPRWPGQGAHWEGLWDLTCWPATGLCPSCVSFLVNRVDPTCLVIVADPLFF